MTESDVDEILKQAARAPQSVNPAVLERIAASMGSSLSPVSPLPPTWALESGLIAVAIAIAMVGAAKAGFFGILKLNFVERMIVFPALGILIFLAASAWVGENIPGSKRRLTPGALFSITTLGILAVFGVLFRNYETQRFLSSGLICLRVGLLHAVPTAFLGWLILRRGYAVNAVASGLVAGILAGLAGVTMLELHCPNFQALHVLIWHTAVIPVSAASGAFLAWTFAKRPTVSKQSSFAGFK
ncbi:MAG TPA: NrsF family protein [Candidatus Acidoferrales bacterium]|jgi:hypothetical protein|nr:NrsF family protein [Candidatus Acidoferrales bacterium]